jgi:hypothetical protein
VNKLCGGPSCGLDALSRSCHRMEDVELILALVGLLVLSPDGMTGTLTERH